MAARTKSRHEVDIEVGVPVGVGLTVGSTSNRKLHIHAVNSLDMDKAFRSVTQLLGWIVEELPDGPRVEFIETLNERYS
jgi:hypothetical protein